MLIWNTGELPEHWTIETLKQKHPSKPYNPAIANVFFLAGLIESRGRGIDKITQKSEQFNNITPNFRMDNGLWVEFNFDIENDGLGEKLGEKLTNNRQAIIESMRNTPLITIAQLSSSIGISTTAIENNLNYLKNNNYIKRTGGDKGGHWEVIE